MRTFKQDTNCLFPNKELFWQAYEYAKTKGVPVYVSVTPDDYDAGYTGIVFNREELCGRKASLTKSEITIAQFFEYCDNWEKLKPVELQLTGDYKAVINKDDKTVKVGCQTIPFDKINELHKLINAQ